MARFKNYNLFTSLMVKGGILSITIALCFIIFFHLVNAQTSDSGVQYDNELNSQFSVNKWIPVTIKIKDITNITPLKSDSIEVQESKDFERKAILNNITDSILLTLSEDEFQLEGKFPLGNGFYGNITKQGFEKLLGDEKIKNIYANKEGNLSLFQSAPLINADIAWNVLGYAGLGQTVCVIDSGVNYSRFDLGGCFGTGCKVLGGYDYIDDDSDPIDEEGHGTNVAGIIASTDSTYKGIANGANMVSLRACDSGSCNNNDVILALQWCYINRNTYNISVVTMSLGFSNGAGQCGTSFANEEINNFWDANIPVIAASGNDGNNDQIDYPACNAQTISVGATYDFDNGGNEMDWCKETGGSRILGHCFGGILDCIDYPEVDGLACFTNKGPLLDLLAPGATITASGSTYAGTSQAAPHVAGAAALLLEKDSSLTPNDILTTLQTSGIDVDGWRRIDVAEALDNICSVISEQAGSCGAGTCGTEERQYIRTTDPVGCAATTFCVPDPSCETGTSACEPTDCPVGYDDNGITCDYSGEFIVCDRECVFDNYCSDFGDWTYDENGFAVDEEDDGTWKSQSIVLDSDYCWDLYSETELDVDNWDAGGVWYYDSESVRVYARNEEGNTVSSCSGGQSSPESANTLSYAVNNYIGDNSIWESTGQFLPYKQGNCQGDNAYGVEGTLHVRTWYRQGTAHVGDTQHESCDVPYIQSISLTSPIYGNSDAQCYVEAKKSETDIDEIEVKWYVNDDRVATVSCDSSGGDSCSDTIGSTWSHTFTLDDLEFKRGDTIYCTAKVYGIDGGKSSTEESNSVEVSNVIPTLSSISLNFSLIEPGEDVQVSATGEGDGDNDLLAMYCCNGNTCTPSLSENDFCYTLEDSSPYDLSCIGQGVSGSGNQTVRCRVYDGEDYSSTSSVNYTIDNSGNGNPPIIVSSGPINNSVDQDGNVTFYISISDDQNIKNVTLYGNWAGGWHANETKSLTGTDNSTSFNKILSGGIYIWNFLAYDNTSKSVWSTNKTLNISIFSPIDNLPATTLISPINNSIDTDGSVIFNCSAVDDKKLINITLYHNLSGVWQANQTKNVSGVSNSTTFTINNIPNGNYAWNCLTYDNSSQSDFGNQNWSFAVNTTSSPSLNINLVYPSGNISVVQNKFFNFTTQVCCSGANCGSINVSLDPESQEETGVYTPYTETHCKGNKCSISLYSNIKFVYEDNTWKKIENARSLKGIFEVIKHDDQNFPAEVIDFNFTSIVLSLGSSEERINSNIPLKVYNKNNESKKPRDNFGSIKSKDKEIKIINTQEKHREIIDLADTGESVLWQEIKWGDNSTTIQLKEPDTENLDDSYIRDGASYSGINYGGDSYLYIRNYSTSNKNVLIRFNTSAIPSYSLIEDASLFMYLETNSLDEGEEYNVSTYNLYNSYIWDEDSVKWDTKPSGSDYNNSVLDEVYIFGGSEEPSNKYISWGVLDAINISSDNVAFYLIANYNNGGDSTDDIRFISKDHAGSNKPYLNITYSKMPKGLISTSVGADPFYTNTSNPTPISLTSGQCVNVTWWVNSTGELNTTHVFFAYANKTSNMSISNITNKINITITEGDKPPVVSLISPQNGYEDGDGIVTFNCSATDTIWLKNITLYGNWSGNWHANETKLITGFSNSTTFTKNLSNDGSYVWNCLAYDNASQNDWNDVNWTVIVDSSSAITFCKNLNAANKVYYLTNNISSNGTCINITANNVTVDGQGYAINYSQVNNGYGIYVSGYNQTTIKNLSLVLNRGGLSGATNSHGINLIDGEEHNITNIDALIQGRTSGTGSDHGINLANIKSSIISEVFINTSSSYLSHPIQITTLSNKDSQDNIITGCKLYSYQLNSRGLSLDGLNGDVSNITIENCVIYSQKSHGAYVDKGLGGNGRIQINNVTITSEGASGQYGLYLSNSDDSSIVDSVISSLNYYDLRVGGGNHALLNVTYTDESVSSGALTRGWYIETQVNSSNSYLENATVEIYNISSVLINSEQTDELGNIGKEGTVEYVNSSGTTTYHTPHTINISKLGYITNSTTYNLSQTHNIYHQVILSSSNSVSLINLVSPQNNSIVNGSPAYLACNVTDDSEIKNISLYGNWSSGWHLNQTKYTELPHNKLDDTLNNLNMTGSLVLNHLNNDSNYGENGSYFFDLSGNGKNLTATSFDGDEMVTGKFNKGVNLDGTNDALQTISSVNAGTNQVTISFWAKTNALSTGDDILAELSNNYNSFNDSWVIYHASAEHIEACLRGSVYSCWNSTYALPVGEWTNIVAIFDWGVTSNESKIYINGNLMGTPRINNNNADRNFGDRVIYVGARGASGNHLNGTIDELSIWNRSLSATEIQRLYNVTKSYYTNFTVNNLADGSYKWNCQAYDNNSQSSFASSNWTFRMETPPLDVNSLTQLYSNSTVRIFGFF